MAIIRASQVGWPVHGQLVEKEKKAGAARPNRDSDKQTKRARAGSKATMGDGRNGLGEHSYSWEAHETFFEQTTTTSDFNRRLQEHFLFLFGKIQGNENNG